MSASPRITDQAMSKMLDSAVKALKQKYPGEAFPLAKDNDASNTLQGCFLAIEAKNILIAVILADLWADMSQKHKSLKMEIPAKCPPGFRISTAPWWPEDSASDGVVDLAADKQANTLADVGFTRLMYLSKKATIKAHAGLFNAETEAEADTPDPDAMDTDEPAVAANVPVIDDLLPAAWDVKKTYRFTRDFRKWPSAGPLPHEVSNLQQAQYGVATDMVFEAIKVEVAKAKRTTIKKTYEVSPDAVALADDTGALSVYGALLDAYKASGGKWYKSATHNAPPEAEKFVRFVIDNKNEYEMRYTSDDGHESLLFPDTLSAIPPEGYASFYVRACKVHVANLALTTALNNDESVADSSVASVSLAGSMSLAGDGSMLDADVVAAPLPAPGPSNSGLGRGGRGGRGARGARGGRGGRGGRRARGGSAPPSNLSVSTTARSTRAGNKRTLDETRDDDENEDDIASLGGPAPKK